MFRRILPYLVSFIIGAAIVIIIMSVNDVYHQTDVHVVLQILSDSFFVPGAILAAVGLLIFATNGGAFDMLAFAGYLFINLFRRDVNDRKYKDFYEYRESKKDRKRPIAYMLIIGLAFVLIAGILLAIYLNI